MMSLFGGDGYKAITSALCDLSSVPIRCSGVITFAGLLFLTKETS